MGSVHATIDESFREFIEAQQIYFVATAPLSAEGHVNLSPKGLDSLRILDDRTVVYCDLVGSGIETVAHVQENGRIVLMFCAFEGAPNIVRLHGQGEVIHHAHPDFAATAQLFPVLTGLRCFVRIRCERISKSCGFGVPLYEFKGHRSELIDWAVKKQVSGVRDYIERKNRTSIDGLPGLDLPDFPAAT